MTSALARAATRSAHVLVVEVPGHWRTRAAVERAVLTRGWSLALSPADADVIAVCGEPSPRLVEAIDTVWNQMPGPRVRVDVAPGVRGETALDEAAVALVDTVLHQRDAVSRPTAADLLPERGHGEMDHGEMDHGEMDHGEMEMAPGGIALAQGGEDRDGLEMDVVHVRLGPVLPFWPGGLVLRCALQGDLVTEAQAELLEAGTQEGGAGTVRTLDNLVSLLALAGWDDVAAETRRIRDATLAHADQPTIDRRLDRLRRSVTRSRLLRWSLRGIRPLHPEDLERHGLPDSLQGDTYDRLVGMLDRARTGDAAPPFPVGVLPPLVSGLDLATARLVVASLDLHELQVSPGHGGTSRG